MLSFYEKDVMLADSVHSVYACGDRFLHAGLVLVRYIPYDTGQLRDTLQWLSCS